MPINLLNKEELNRYIALLIYQGETIASLSTEELKNINFITNEKDKIIRALIYQWAKKAVPSFLTTEENASFLIKVTSTDKDSPSWLSNALINGKDVRLFDPSQLPASFHNDLQEITDYLHNEANIYIDKVLSRDAPKIMLDALKNPKHKTFSLTLEQAQKWHQKLVRVADEKKSPGKEQLELLQDTKHIMDLGDGFTAVQLLSPTALDMETKYMGHCIGGGSYDKGVQDGSISVYSIRDKSGMPHATCDVKKGIVMQCKGKANKPIVKKYIPYVKRFVEEQNFDLRYDSRNLGLCRDINGKFYETNNIPTHARFKDLDLSEMKLSALPDLYSVEIEGTFNCSKNNITDLRGCPLHVSTIYCAFTPSITSLAGCSNEAQILHCNDTSISSLKGSGDNLQTIFCNNTPISNLVGCGTKVDTLYCQHCQNLNSLKGCGENVVTLNCSYAPLLTNLNGCGENVYQLYCSDCKALTSLAGCGECVKILDCSNCASLTSLAGLKGEVKEIDCSDCVSLTSLKGCPRKMQIINCSNCPSLSSLEGCGRNVTKLICVNCSSLTSLEGCPATIAEIICNNCPNLKYIPSYIPNDKIKGLNENQIMICKTNWQNQQKRKVFEGAQSAIFSKTNCL